jgi:hypothetical protein
MAKGSIIGDETEKIIVAGGLAVGAYLFIVKPILAKLGLEDNQDKKDIEALDPSQNPFSIHFDPGDGTVTDDEVLAAGEAVNENPADFFVSGDNYNMAVYIAQKVYDSMNLNGVDNDAIIAAFQEIQSKKDVSAMAVYFELQWQADLWDYLTKGWRVLGGLFGSQGGVNSDTLTRIVDYVKQLPDE